MPKDYNEELEGLVNESDKFVKYIVKVNHPKKVKPYREAVYSEKAAMATDLKKMKKNKNKKTKFLGL